MTAQVSSRGGVAVSGILAPLRVRRLGQIGSRRNAHQALERTEERMATRGKLPGLLRRLLKVTHGRVLLCDAAENEFAGFDVDLLGDESGIEPDLRHHIVPGIIAPPDALMLRGRQLPADHAFNLREGHGDLSAALLTEEVPERG